MKLDISETVMWPLIWLIVGAIAMGLCFFAVKGCESDRESMRACLDAGGQWLSSGCVRCPRGKP